MFRTPRVSAGATFPSDETGLGMEYSCVHYYLDGYSIETDYVL